MTPTRFFFSFLFLFFSFFFFVFSLLVARASPGSTLCDFGYSIRSRNRCRFARFFLSWTIFSQHHVYDGNIYLLHVWMYLSLMFVRAKFWSVDAYSNRFWASLLPQTWSARINFGSYCLKGAPLSVKSPLSSGNPSL